MLHSSWPLVGFDLEGADALSGPPCQRTETGNANRNPAAPRGGLGNVQPRAAEAAMARKDPLPLALTPRARPPVETPNLITTRPGPRPLTL